MEREELLQTIMDFIAEMEDQGKSFTGILYTGESIIISSKEKILDTAEQLGIEIDPDMEEQETLFIALDEDEDDDYEGILQ